MLLDTCLTKYGKPHCIGHFETLDGAWQWLTVQQCYKQYGHFYCTGEYPTSDAVEPLEFTVVDSGFEVKKKAVVNSSLLRTAAGSSGLSFPNKPVIPNKPAGFA